MGAKYRKVDPKIWMDEVVDDMTKDEVFCMLWLLTSNATNRCGISVFSLGEAVDRNRVNDSKEMWTILKTITSKLDWPIEKVTRSTVVIVLSKWFKYNGVTNEKHLKGVMSDLHETPQCETVKKSRNVLRHYVKKDLQSLYDTLWDRLYDSGQSGYTIPVAVTVAIDSSSNNNNTDGDSSNSNLGDGKMALLFICEHYKTYHPNARPGDKERKMIRDRMKEGYKVDDLKRAIDGCHRTPHNLGDNERGTKYLSLSLIMRSSSHVIRFLENADNPVPVIRKSSSQNFDSKRTNNGDPDFGVM